jgi:hypothetical protein
MLDKMQMWIREMTIASPLKILGLKTTAKRILQTSRQNILHKLWSQLSTTGGINLKEDYSLCHPAVIKCCIPFIANLHHDLVPPVIFLAHREALDVTNTGSLWAPAATCLGTSEISFTHFHEKIITSNVSSREAGQIIRAPAAVLYSSESQNLIESAIAFAKLPVLRFDDHSGQLEGGTLLVAPRYALANIIKSLTGIADVLATTIKEFRNQRCATSDNGPPTLAVMSLELITSHNPTKDVLWKRCVIIGWPHTAIALDQAGARPRTHFTVGVAHENDLESGLIGEGSNVETWKIASLMSAPEWCLDEPDTLLRVLQTRFFKVSSNSEQQQQQHRDAIIPYSVLMGPAPNRDEENFRRGARGIFRDRSFVFPAFASLRGPFRRVMGEGVEDVRRHFRNNGIEVTGGFANRNIEEMRRDDGTHKECPICYECRAETVTACGHWFCAGCLKVSLDRDSVCPICKTPTNKEIGVVSVGRAPSMSESQDACLPFLANSIKSALTGRTIVVASFHELHDRVCKALVSIGVPIRVWGGSASQIIKNEEDFKNGSIRSLLIDPCEMPCRWTSFSDVEQILILFPLCTRRMESCCQIKEVVDACKGNQPKIVFIIRDERNIPEMNPTCKEFREISNRCWRRCYSSCTYLVRGA